MELRRTTSSDPDLPGLIAALDQHLWAIYGSRMEFFEQFNDLEVIKHTVIASVDGNAVGCGSIKHYAEGVLEVKRMYVADSARGKGVGAAILSELETWARQLGYTYLQLETGDELPAAVKLYTRSGFALIENY